MRFKPLPSQAEIRRLLDYNSETGEFIWRFRSEGPTKWNSHYAGKPAGTVMPNGYAIIVLNYVHYRAHRLAWVYVYGDVLSEEEEIDHRDNCRSHNWISNLRPSTKSQNMANSHGWKKRPSQGLPKGVFMCKGRYQASVMRDRVKHHLGTFDTPEEAANAYLIAATALSGEFARGA